jgi:hypothetical protein
MKNKCNMGTINNYKNKPKHVIPNIYHQIKDVKFLDTLKFASIIKLISNLIYFEIN